MISNNISDKTPNQTIWYFRGVTHWNGLKICCSPYDKHGEKIEVNKEKFNESNHDKSFLFSNFSGNLKIIEIHYFGEWHKYKFCDAWHCAWIPNIVEIDLSVEEQKKAFLIFKKLVINTEKINGFSINDKKHSINKKPEFKSLLIRILNSKIYQSLD